jgi:hypothetical protein
MIELPDDELDKLFRKSSEELDPQFDPEDWANMKKKLDQHDGRTAGAWVRKWWPLGVLALLVPIGIVVYRYTHVNERGVVGRMEDGGKGGRRIEVLGRMEEGENGGGNDAGVGEDSAGLKGNAVEKIKILPRSLAKTGGVYLEPDRSKTGGGDGAFSFEKSGKVNRSNASKSVRIAKEGRNASKPVRAANEGETEVTGRAGNFDAPNAHAGAAVGLNTTEKTAQPNLNVAALDNRDGKWGNTLEMPVIAALTQPAEQVEPEKRQEEEPVSTAKWAVRFGYSPDLSTVGLKDFSKPGTAVSLLAEYAISNRLYIQSGAVWSRKEYYGRGDSYQLPKIPHYYPPEIIAVDGMCKVLEVPVNLRFDILDRRKSTVFVSAGVSSYHMNKEKYDYEFENNYDPNIKYRGWEGKTGWYWLSHLNVSAGYEYKLSNKLSLLAEPYLRAPLKRVGYGKVNLFTTGLWISVRFKPAFR